MKNELQMMPGVEWVVAEEETVTPALAKDLVGTPTTELTPVPIEELVDALVAKGVEQIPTHEQQRDGQSFSRIMAIVIIYAYMTLAVIVALLIAAIGYLDNRGGIVFMIVTLVGAGILCVALPIQRSTVSPCTPSRINFTGHDQ